MLLEWERADLIRPKNNLISHSRIDEPKFYASYEHDGSRPNMCCLLQHFYGAIWLREHNAFLKNKLLKTIVPLRKNKEVTHKTAQKLKKETKKVKGGDQESIFSKVEKKNGIQH